MYFEKILSLRRTVAFRLTLWYASFFTGGILTAFIVFYFLLHRGIHNVHLSPYSLHELLEAYRRFFGYALAVVALGSLSVGWFLARRALSGVVHLTRIAEAVAEGALKERVPVKGRKDEIDHLAMTFNVMLERINVLIQGMKETNDNIAHDLRSPITLMRGIAEAALMNNPSSDTYHALASDIIEQCDGLLGMINTMLDISEAEAGVVKLVMEEIDIVPIVQDAVGLFSPMAEDKHIDMKIEVPDHIRLYSDKRKIQRLLGNLLDNAIKFTPPNGTIAISVCGNEKQVTIAIRDTGIGMSEEDRKRIFERFFRSDKSRSEPGSGLGLSLARAFAYSLGGSITATSVPGQGSTFMVTLPFGPESGVV